MSFLTPWFLLGALAVAGPILFHLIRRTTRERIPFSTLMFLHQTPPQVTRHSRIQDWLLLILRCLVLLLLAFGFARPFLSAWILPPDPSRLAGRRVILVDTSASMRRAGLMEAARDRIGTLLDRFPPGDAVAVYRYDHKVAPVVTFEEWSEAPPTDRKRLVRERAESLEAGWGATHLDQALIQSAERLLEVDPSETLVQLREVYLISDLQSGSRLQGLASYEWPEDVQLHLEKLDDVPVSDGNAGIELVAVAASGSPNPLDERSRVRVVNSRSAAIDQFRVTWDPKSDRWIDIVVPPGQSRVFYAPALADGLRFGTLHLVGDSVDFDNVAFYTQPVSRETRVDYFGGASESDPNGPLYYLRRAFPEMAGQSVRIAVRAPGTEGASATGAEAAVSGQANSFFVIADVLSDEEAGAVRAQIEKGGLALLIMRGPGDGGVLARLAGLDSFPISEASVNRYALLGEIDFKHPLFSPFADPRFSDFTRIHFWKHRVLDPDYLPNARVLAAFDSGDPALVEIPVGKGLLLVLATTWTPRDSQLALSSKFVPLLQSMFEYGGMDPDARRTFRVGDPVAASDLIGTRAGVEDGDAGLVVRLPDGAERDWPGRDPFSETDLPGIYTVMPDEVRFSVNLAIDESQTDRMDHSELEKYGIVLNSLPNAVSAGVDSEVWRSMASTELESRQRLWRWLLLAAAVLLILESGLAAFRTKRTGALGR